MTTTDKPAQTAQTFRDAERDDVLAACRYATRRLADLFSTTAMIYSDPVANLVGGYALAELHRIGLLASVATVLEHARAALAEFGGAAAAERHA